MNKFWIIADEDGDTDGATYETLQEAKTAAETRATENGVRTYVCEAMEACEVEIKWANVIVDAHAQPPKPV